MAGASVPLVSADVSSVMAVLVSADTEVAGKVVSEGFLPLHETTVEQTRTKHNRLDSIFFKGYLLIFAEDIYLYTTLAFYCHLNIEAFSRYCFISFSQQR